MESPASSPSVDASEAFNMFQIILANQPVDDIRMEELPEAKDTDALQLPPLPQARKEYAQAIKELFLQRQPSRCVDMLARYPEELEILRAYFLKKFAARCRSSLSATGGKELIFGDPKRKKIDEDRQVFYCNLSDFEQRRVRKALKDRAIALRFAFRASLYLGDVESMGTYIQWLPDGMDLYANTADPILQLETFMERLEASDGHMTIEEVRKIANTYARY